MGKQITPRTAYLFRKPIPVLDPDWTDPGDWRDGEFPFRNVMTMKTERKSHD